MSKSKSTSIFRHGVKSENMWDKAISDAGAVIEGPCLK